MHGHSISLTTVSLVARFRAFARNLLATPQVKELEATGAQISSITGLPYHTTGEGETVAGAVSVAVDLSSGRSEVQVPSRPPAAIAALARSNCTAPARAVCSLGPFSKGAAEQWAPYEGIPSRMCLRAPGGAIPLGDLPSH
jgi:hypothetical protein